MVCDKLCTFAIVRLRETMHNRIHFTKMDGAGNDYIYVDTTRYPISDPQTASVKWSNRHTGIGSDGLVLIGKPSILSGADFSYLQCRRLRSQDVRQRKPMYRQISL